MERLKLTSPLGFRPRITQHFGSNNACLTPEGKIKPKFFGLVCLPGQKEFYKIQGLKGHTGVDYAAKHGQACLYAGPTGTVVEIETEEARGLGVGIVTDSRYQFTDAGQSFAKTRYWHLKDIVVTKGQKVERGDLVGHCDNTGSSSRDHLHFELKPVDYGNDGKMYNVMQDNGYCGAVDPEEYYEN